MEYDVFISHASEDKADIARPLAMHLQQRGLKVWIDEFELTLGDSLRRSIDRGLSQSRYGVVILSPAFFTKEWPNKELDGLVAREDGRGKVILPIWHNVGHDEIARYSPLLADKIAVSTSRGLENVAKRIVEAVRGDLPQENSKLLLASTESKVLEEIWTKMLVADSSWELRRTFYEVDQYLAKYPHSADARLLKDRIQVAMMRAEEMGPPLPKAAPRGCLLPLAVGIGVGILAYLLYKLLW